MSKLAAWLFEHSIIARGLMIAAAKRRTRRERGRRELSGPEKRRLRRRARRAAKQLGQLELHIACDRAVRRRLIRLAASYYRDDAPEWARN